MALNIAAIVDPETQTIIERDSTLHKTWEWHWHADLASALPQLRNNHADVVLAETSVAPFDLKRTPPQILAQNGGVKIIVVSDTLSHKDIINALVAGAHGCMPRSSIVADLDAAVETVMANRVFISAALTPNGKAGE